MSSSAAVAPSAAAPAAPTDLRVTFLGTGAPRPSFDRYGPIALVEAGPQRILVDPGPGLRERLLQAGSFEFFTGLDHVLVSHLHFDHTVSLPDLWLTGWLYGRRTPLVVEGPVGTQAMMRHVEQAFSWDVAYREAVGVPSAGVAIEARDVTPGVVFERDGLTVTAFEVEHMPIDVKTRKRLPFEGQTLGFRFDYHGHSLVLSGDTRPSENLVTHARGVDVLVHEVQVPSPDETDEAKLANVSLSVHTEPKDAAGIFTRAQAAPGGLLAHHSARCDRDAAARGHAVQRPAHRRARSDDDHDRRPDHRDRPSAGAGAELREVRRDQVAGASPPRRRTVVATAPPGTPAAALPSPSVVSGGALGRASPSGAVTGPGHRRAARSARRCGDGPRPPAPGRRRCPGGPRPR